MRDVDSLNVRCKGYEIAVAERSGRSEIAVWLSRVDGEYSQIITPQDFNRYGSHPSQGEFADAVKDEISSDSVRLTCFNNTETAIDLILIEFIPDGDPRPKTGEILLKPPCLPKESQSYTNLGRDRVFHWVFASRFGQPAEFLALRHLYYAANPRVQIDSHGGKLTATWE